jgi:alpha/beta superfamily hydrolase
MNPLFFGSSQRPLYGVYHPPKARTSRAVGVVLCYPLWQEYMRAHRAFRQLAMLLSKAGFPVLRFDYFATGDSGGQSDEGDVAQWVADIGTAIDELKDMASVTKVSLVGLRVGASLAAMAALPRKDLEHVLLWDPVVSGARFLESLRSGSESPSQSTGASRADASKTIGISGFPLTPSMRKGLQDIDLLAAPTPSVRALTLVVSEERDDFGALRDALAARSTTARYRHIASAGNWDEIDRFGSALLPQQIIQGIVSCLAGEVTS